MSIIQANPEPLNPAIGSCVPNKASLAIVVGSPFLLSATPDGIFKPSLSARLKIPRFIFVVDESKINGTLPVGEPKQIGLVPNKGFRDPKGANAGGAFVKQNTINFFFYSSFCIKS